MEESYIKDSKIGSYCRGGDSKLPAIYGGLCELLDSEEPLILEDSEGSMWMRGSCGTRPC